MQNIYLDQERLNNARETIENLGQSITIEEKRKEALDLEKKTLEPGFWDDTDKAQKLIGQINGLKSYVEAYDDLNDQAEEIEILIELLREEDDEESYKDLEKALEKLEKNTKSFEIKTLLTGEYDKENAILSIHAGAGGTEAQDWADMLLRMYTRYAEGKGYKVTVLDILKEEEAGIKSATLSIEGLNAYGYLKAEKGVHRLVRISPFDAAKKRHTSFASVDVYPEFSEQIEVDIKDEDLKIDTYRSSGAGGQHVNTTDSAVRITHIPTGVVVQCQNERSQIQNREKAMQLLTAKLLAIKEEEQKEKIEDLQGNYNQIAWGSQIRSYVFNPYQMVKDHRTNIEVGDTQRVMDGDLDIFVDGYLQMKAK
ncbi:peptide chain release factor 2 [Neofamilia massiliensis]|uniref:peptide chain release factor 2 n=1 Tax=Neofamilia massiliensis TaxID=1673724 RepID=UPI0006BB8899|nr:peptide chain release factor 2 [Neofamilia massiliensis]